MRPRPRAFALTLLLLPVLAGCGGAVRVTGQVVDNGRPYPVDPAGQFTMTFHGTDPKGGQLVFPAAVGEDGRFRVAGPDGAGVPPGTYRVSVSDGATARSRDKWQNRYAPEKTPLTVEVAGRGVDLTIDVGRGTVTP